MNDDFSKLRLEQQHAEEIASVHPTVQEQGRQFASVEEIIRTDKQQVEVPPAIAERLNESIAGGPSPRKKSWWRRIFGS
jgi:hypothetical protein